MYSVITQGNFSSPVFPYIYLGNAFYLYVAAVMTGVSWAVIDDREHYRTLKYIYIAPIHIPTYLMGRGVARFITGTFSVVITILFGIFFLHLPFRLDAVDWPLFIVSLLIGIFMLAMLGLVLAGIALMMAQHNFFIGDAVAAALFLFSGAIFPLSVLPELIRPIGYIMPVTYWLELLRRALIGSVAEAFPTLAGFTNLQLLGILAGLTIVFALLSIFIFRLCDHRARERGLIDQTNNY